ncbi:PAS domain S-box protein [Pedobacter cryoconitis]|uniref:histidine kinase n=1 Tax=Pedobacter cryoconitis TaxID=188932 RepID=A0A7X0J0A5_9SPHI|nr:PAS domain S-box protein [Pedobacter cryoconitis]MBB6498673.1 PAS domain S-box-containing protein [Pedobacter cryoconitis]
MNALNNLYKDLFQLSPQSMWIYDTDTLYFIDVNDAAILQYGYSREEFLKMTIQEIIPDKDKINQSPRHVKKSGEIIDVELKTNLFDLNNKTARLVIITDITEQLRSAHTAKKLKEELLLSETRFKALVQGGSDLISIIDIEGKYQFISESWDQILTIKPESLLHKSAFEFIHPEDRERVKEKVSRLRKVKRITIEPFRFLNGKNEWTWLATTATNLTDDPAICGIVTNSKIITDVITKTEELRQSNERYKLVLKASDEAICDWDIENGIVDWGIGFQEIFGYELNVSDNTIWSDNIHPDDKQRVLKEIDEAIENPATEILYSEYRFLKANREITHIQYRGIFLRNSEGRATRIVGSFRDITTHKNSLYQFKKQNERLQEIAWMQSHKIRDSLARIIGLVDLFKDEDFINDSQKQLLDYLSISATELDAGIREIVKKAQLYKADQNVTF